MDFHQQQAAWLDRLPEGPTFRPTKGQFEDPLAYIRSIQGEAATYGARALLPATSSHMTHCKYQTWLHVCRECPALFGQSLCICQTTAYLISPPNPP